MGERIIVSGGGELREMIPGERRVCRRVQLEGAGALLTAGGNLFAACDRGNVIWRMDGRTLAPGALFSGGPGVCQMLASRDGERLYALCGEADSLLALSARSGAPLLLNRVGVCPCAMAMDDVGETIAVAGGACGEVVLLRADTLCVTRRLQTAGVVFSALIAGNLVFALSLTESMNTELNVFRGAQAAQVIPLPGMPGALAKFGGRIAAATHEQIALLSEDGSRVVQRWPAQGRAGRMIPCSAGLLTVDTWTETLFLQTALGGRAVCLAAQARDAALLI